MRDTMLLTQYFNPKESYKIKYFLKKAKFCDYELHPFNGSVQWQDRQHLRKIKKLL